ncbi:hypothetical protein ACSFCK_05560 [Brevibacterium luteolum]|uniref:hypothetical protein n=1 Tax=Brevibacterium luteolum TaxID=199591 RepID=UPI003EE827E8
MKYISRAVVAVVSCFLLAEVSLVPEVAHALPEVAELRNTAETSGYPVIEESMDGSLYIYNPQKPVDRITQEQVPDEWISALPSESTKTKYVVSGAGALAAMCQVFATPLQIQLVQPPQRNRLITTILTL